MAALDLGAGVEQPFNRLIVLNRQAMQSMGRLMDWTLEGDMVDVNMVEEGALNVLHIRKSRVVLCPNLVFIGFQGYFKK